MSHIVFSQDSVVSVRLEEALQQAMQNNRDLSIQQTEEQIASARYKETEAIFLPRVSAGYSALLTNNPLNAFGFRLQQARIKAQDFNPDQLNHPSSTADFLTQLEVQQPLLNMDMLYQRKSAGLQREMYALQTLRGREYLTYQVKKACLQLQLAYDAQSVWKQALETARAMLRFTRDRVGQGLLQQSDALNAEVQVMSFETQVTASASRIQDASDYLGLLMGKPLGIRYQISEQGKDEGSGEDTARLVPAARADLAAGRKALESMDLMIRSLKLAGLPRLNAFAAYQFNDNTMLGFGAHSYLAGLQLSWNLFNGNSRHRQLETKMLERSRQAAQLNSLEEKSQLELNAVRRQLEDARFRIRQQELAVKSAEEALRILQNRYGQGLVNSTDVLQSQTQLAQQRLQLADARFQSGSTAAYLQFLTSTTSSQQ